MLMYAISLVPLIRQLSGLSYQVWYADDAAAGGKLLQLCQLSFIYWLSFRVFYKCKEDLVSC